MFVMLETVDGRRIAVNPVQVTAVTPPHPAIKGQPKGTRVCLSASDEDYYKVKGTVEEIVAKLESATLALTLALNMMRCIGPEHEHRDPEWHTLCAQVRELAGVDASAL